MDSPAKDRVLEIGNLHLSFRSPEAVTEALRGVSLTVERGEIVGIVGESGSGKSVTAMSVLKLLPGDKARVTSGTITLLGRNILRHDEAAMRSIRGQTASMIFQEPMTALNPVRRIGDQITEVLTRQGILQESAFRDYARKLLTDMRIDDPDRVLDAYPHELSGGLRQRVLIAMAFSGKPELIIADEPTTALDVTVQAQILSLLKDKARETDTSVIFISHDLAVVAQLCDRVYVMYKGEIVESGRTDDVIRRPRHVYTRALLNALPEGKPRKARLETVAAAMLEGGSAAESATAAPPPATPPPAAAEPGEALLELIDAELYYPKARDVMGRPIRFHPAVDGVDLTLFKGETLAIVGESGSGKTSIAKLVVGLERPTAGEIHYRGTPLEGRRSAEVRRDIQMVFQDPQSSLNPRMRAWQLVTEPLTVGGGLSRARLRDKAAELLTLVGLEPDQMTRFPHEFSGGQRQRLAIGRALAVHPKILVLDEPTSALDVSVQAQILNLLIDLQREQGLTYLFISHDVAVVRHISDRVAVMFNGRIVERGPVDAVLENPQETYTKTLMEAVPHLRLGIA